MMPQLQMFIYRNSFKELTQSIILSPFKVPVAYEPLVVTVVFSRSFIAADDTTGLPGLNLNVLGVH